MTNRIMISFFIAILIAASASYAIPVITSTSGTWSHGATITISGSGFTTKAQNTPLKYDNFETGTNGNLVTGWQSGVGSNSAKYSSEQVRGKSTRCSHHAYRRPGNQTIALCLNNYGPGFPVIFVDYWVKAKPIDYWSRNWKSLFFYGNNETDDYLQMHWVTMATEPLQGSPMALSVVNEFRDMAPNGTERLPSGVNWGDITIDTTQWYHHQFVYRENTIGSANGTFIHSINGVPDGFNSNSMITRSGNWHYDEIRVGYFWATDELSWQGEVLVPANGGADVYFDNVYIDTTWARVEIGNAQTYAASSKREIQPYTMWSDGSICINVQQGSFADGSNAYVFVVDRNNIPCSQGVAITFGQSTRVIYNAKINGMMEYWKNGNVYDVFGKNVGAYRDTPVSSNVNKFQKNGIYFTIINQNGKQTVKKYLSIQ